MTPGERAALIERAKTVALPVAACIQAGITPGHLMSDLSWTELAALVVVLAEAADHARLAELVRLPGDETLTRSAMWDATLRWAHAEAGRVRKAGQPVPPWLARLDAQYDQSRPRKARPSRGNGSWHAWRQDQEGTAA